MAKVLVSERLILEGNRGTVKKGQEVLFKMYEACDRKYLDISSRRIVERCGNRKMVYIGVKVFPIFGCLKCGQLFDTPYPEKEIEEVL